MDIKILAGILAGLCLIGLALAIYILKIQIPLLKAIDTQLERRVRYLYFGTVVFIVMGLSSLLILDIMTIFFDLKRSTETVNAVGVYITLMAPLIADVSLAKQAVMYYLIKKEQNRVKNNR